jgi:hypothetical protein
VFKDLDEMVKDENKRNPRDYTKAKMEEVDARRPCEEQAA